MRQQSKINHRLNLYGYLVLTIPDHMYVAWINSLISVGCAHSCTGCWFCWLVVLIISHFGPFLPPSPQAFSLSGEILFPSFWSPQGPCGCDLFSHTRGQVKPQITRTNDSHSVPLPQVGGDPRVFSTGQCGQVVKLRGRILSLPWAKHSAIRQISDSHTVTEYQSARRVMPGDAPGALGRTLCSSYPFFCLCDAMQGFGSFSAKFIQCHALLHSVK